MYTVYIYTSFSFYLPLFSPIIYSLAHFLLPSLPPSYSLAHFSLPLSLPPSLPPSLLSPPSLLPSLSFSLPPSLSFSSLPPSLPPSLLPSLPDKDFCNSETHSAVSSAVQPVSESDPLSPLNEVLTLLTVLHSYAQNGGWTHSTIQLAPSVLYSGTPL